MLRIYRVFGGTKAPHPLAVAEAADVLAAGGLALLPTETVYGIGVCVSAFSDCDAGLPPEGSGYRRIFSLKNRDLAQTVPWLVDGAQALDRYGTMVDGRARLLASAFWPGALTLVVRAGSAVPPFLRAADGTIALRASASPVVQALVRACGAPLAVTSANTHGASAPASFSQVEPRVLAGVDVAVDAGPTCCQEASTIVSCTGRDIEVLREGAIPATRIFSAVSDGEDGGSPVLTSKTQ